MPEPGNEFCSCHADSVVLLVEYRYFINVCRVIHGNNLLSNVPQERIIVVEIVEHADTIFLHGTLYRIAANEPQRFMVTYFPNLLQILRVYLIGRFPAHVLPSAGCIVVFIQPNIESRDEFIHRWGDLCYFFVGHAHELRALLGVLATVCVPHGAELFFHSTEEPFHGLCLPVVWCGVDYIYSKPIYQRMGVIPVEIL